jgi:phosphatidylglycerophosphatase A
MGAGSAMTPLFETDVETRRVALRTPAGLFAFGFGSGLARFAPGTMGTLAAVPFALLLKQLPGFAYGAALAVLFLAGVWFCAAASRALGRHDPGGIVWDEMVGYWLTVALLPPAWGWWLAAFVLFRFFDILKPWPIRQVERSFAGGLGIMLDDVFAALYAMLALAGSQYLLGQLSS